MELTSDAIDELRCARQRLESTSFAARIANAVGTPVEGLLRRLPSGAQEAVVAVTHRSLAGALKFAFSTLDPNQQSSSDALHKIVVAATGAAGGAFGLPALAIELPVSTIIMLRSIADIARSEDEPLESDEAKLACLQVFSLGGPQRGDDAVESGYFAVRAALASTVTEAVEYIAERGVAEEGAPVLVRLTTRIAARFGVPVSEKVLAQSIPIIGAAGGALVNLLFIDHFQNLARGHFVVRRLERQYGTDVVRQAYLAL